VIHWEKKMSKNALFSASALAALLLVAGDARAADVTYLDQGWSAAERAAYYSLDQGSRIVPFDWIKALRRADGSGFLDDGFARYGYLANPASLTPGLPVGFLTAAYDDQTWLSMTCSACHTRQIEIDGAPLRIDGGPALVEFERLFDDLDAAFDKVATDDAAFDAFAGRVLGAGATKPAQEALRQAFRAWFEPFHTIFQLALHPKEKPRPLGLEWGPGRADAVSMIFNRVAGLDLGDGPTRVIHENIVAADAPVRYPFVWNAARQYITQWPGFAKNGDDILGLARNVGEVFGVFGKFLPERTNLPIPLPGLLRVNYIQGSSLDFGGLMQAETLIRKLAPPKWPAPVDAALARAGKEIFDWPRDKGGCGPGCHELKAIDPVKEPPRLCAKPEDTWTTPVQYVGTDGAEYAVLGRKAKTGVLEGEPVPLPPFIDRLGESDKIINILSTAVVQSIVQSATIDPLAFDPLVKSCLSNLSVDPAKNALFLKANLAEALRESLNAIFNKAAPTEPAYESRVLRGVWAAAPYLHNGSVPTLADLLKPPAQRPASFPVGPAYDMRNVGLSGTQTKFNFVYKTTAACDSGDASANSRCGHDFGTKLRDRKSTRLNSSHRYISRMPSSA
jgi:hypothetical protein